MEPFSSESSPQFAQNQSFEGKHLAQQVAKEYDVRCVLNSFIKSSSKGEGSLFQSNFEQNYEDEQDIPLPEGGNYKTLVKQLRDVLQFIKVCKTFASEDKMARLEYFFKDYIQNENFGINWIKWKNQMRQQVSEFSYQTYQEMLSTFSNHQASLDVSSSSNLQNLWKLIDAISDSSSNPVCQTIEPLEEVKEDSLLFEILKFMMVGKQLLGRFSFQNDSYFSLQFSESKSQMNYTVEIFKERSFQERVLQLQIVDGNILSLRNRRRKGPSYFNKQQTQFENSTNYTNSQDLGRSGMMGKSTSNSIVFQNQLPMNQSIHRQEEESKFANESQKSTEKFNNNAFSKQSQGQLDYQQHQTNYSQQQIQAQFGSGLAPSSSKSVASGSLYSQNEKSMTSSDRNYRHQEEFKQMDQSMSEFRENEFQEETREQKLMRENLEQAEVIESLKKQLAEKEKVELSVKNCLPGQQTTFNVIGLQKNQHPLQ